MRKLTIYAVLALVIVGFASCNKDEEISKSKDCDIVSFSDGSNSWIINNLEIKGIYPLDSDISAISPTIVVSNGATVSPTSGMVQDFSDGKTVTYTVTAEDGVTKKIYTAKAIGNISWSIANNTLTISGEGEIPNYSYTSNYISTAPWGAYRDSFTDVIIENGITSIGEYAFYNCIGLTSITISNTVTSIRYCAFLGCSSLTSITIPNSVTLIDYMAFNGCSSLTSITIPNSVTSIGYTAFENCGNLAAITVAESSPNYSSIDGVLYNKQQTTLIKYPQAKTGTTFTIPNSVTSIGEDAFIGCRLTSITIPNSVTLINYGAFFACYGLTSITIPESVTSIIEQAFTSCSGLTAINVDANNQYYSSIDGVLYNKQQTTLIKYPLAKTGTTFTIPNSVTSISNDAFSACLSLTSVTIPESVTSIGQDAFTYCRNLVEIINYATIPQILDDNFPAFREVNKTTCVLRVPTASISAYRAAKFWNDFVNIVAIE